ncbi:unnamed protein product, partial [Cyprideis torosa]
MIQDIAKEAARKASDAVPNVASHYMQLTILGLRHPEQNDLLESATTEVVLQRFCGRRRKESSNATEQISVGTCAIPVNPNEASPPPFAPLMSLPPGALSGSVSTTKSLKPISGPAVPLSPTPSSSSSQPSAVSHPYLLFRITNFSQSSCDEVDEPPAKRRKSRSKSSGEATSSSSPTPTVLESELAVFDRTGTCTLRPGDYFIPLTPPLNARDLKSPSRKFA